MDLATQILVVILSVVLALFLILGIVLVIYLIKISRQIHKITESAENVVNSFDTILSRAVAMSSPAFFVSSITRMFKKFKKNKDKGEK